MTVKGCACGLSLKQVTYCYDIGLSPVCDGCIWTKYYKGKWLHRCTWTDDCPECLKHREHRKLEVAKLLAKVRPNNGKI